MNRKLVAGNWKMNGLRADLQTIRHVAAALTGSPNGPEALLCVPATLLADAAKAVEGSNLRIGGQTCHPAENGAFTGDVSASMLCDAGATDVILGHSERRTAHAESDESVAAQASAALKAGLMAIICVGETAGERGSGQTLAVVELQLKGSLAGLAAPDRLAVAYEPLWAIGTGKVATPAQIAEVHDFVRLQLIARFGPAGVGVRILYGGSLNPVNASEILGISNVDGGLIGGASLKAEDFLAIYQKARALQQ